MEVDSTPRKRLRDFAKSDLMPSELIAGGVPGNSLEGRAATHAATKFPFPECHKCRHRGTSRKPAEKVGRKIGPAQPVYRFKQFKVGLQARTIRSQNNLALQRRHTDPSGCSLLFERGIWNELPLEHLELFCAWQPVTDKKVHVDSTWNNSQVDEHAY